MKAESRHGSHGQMCDRPLTCDLGAAVFMAAAWPPIRTTPPGHVAPRGQRGPAATNDQRKVVSHDNAAAARTLQALRHNAYGHHQAPLVVRATGHPLRALQSQTQPARAQAAGDPAEPLPPLGQVNTVRSLLGGQCIFAAVHNHEYRPLPVLEQRNAVTCTYPGGRPPTCADVATAGLSVCLSLACVGNFRGAADA